jgi:uncharacterized membrane protein YfcA
VDLPLAVAVLLSATAASSIQSLSGFGFSLFIVPVLAVLIGPKETVLLANILSTGLNAVQLPSLRGHVEWQLSRWLLVGSFIGMPLGLAVLLIVDPTTLKLIIAGTVVVFTALLVRGFRVHTAGRTGDLVAGAISGVLNTSTSMSGPPIVIYLQGRSLPSARFRASACFYFLVSAAGAVVLLSLGGASTQTAWLAALVAVPGVIAGRLIGNACYDRIDERRFRGLVYAVLLLSAAIAIGTTLLG